MTTTRYSDQQYAILDALNRFGVLHHEDIADYLSLQDQYDEDSFDSDLESLLKEAFVAHVSDIYALTQQAIQHLNAKGYDIIQSKPQDLASPECAQILWKSHAYLSIARLLKDKKPDTDYQYYSRQMTRKAMAPLYQLRYEQNIKNNDGLIYDGQKYFWLEMIDASISQEALLSSFRVILNSILDWKGPQPGDIYVIMVLKGDEAEALKARITDTFLTLKKDIPSKSWWDLIKRFLTVRLELDENHRYTGHTVEYLAKLDAFAAKNPPKPHVDVAQALSNLQSLNASDLPSTTEGQNRSNTYRSQLTTLSSPVRFDGKADNISGGFQNSIFYPKSDEWLLQQIAIALNAFGSMSQQEVVQYIRLLQPLLNPTASHLSETPQITRALQELIMMRVGTLYQKERRPTGLDKYNEHAKPLIKPLYSLTEQAASYLNGLNVDFHEYSPEQDWERLRSGDYYFEDRAVDEQAHQTMLWRIQQLIKDLGDTFSWDKLTLYSPFLCKRGFADALLAECALDIDWESLEVRAIVQYEHELWLCLYLPLNNYNKVLSQDFSTLWPLLLDGDKATHTGYQCRIHYMQPHDLSHNPTQTRTDAIEAAQRQLALGLQQHVALHQLGPKEKQQIAQQQSLSIYLIENSYTYHIVEQRHIPLTNIDALFGAGSAAEKSLSGKSDQTKAPAVEAKELYDISPAGRISATGYDFTLQIGQWYYYEFPNFLQKTPDVVFGLAPEVREKHQQIFCPIGVEDDYIAVISVPTEEQRKALQVGGSLQDRLKQMTQMIYGPVPRFPVYHLTFPDVATRYLAAIESPWELGKPQEVVRNHEQAATVLEQRTYSERSVAPSPGNAVDIRFVRGLFGKGK